MGVTPKQAMFVAEYLIDGNATRAAIAAGFAAGSAHVTGARLLKHATVAAAIAERQERRKEKLKISAERVLEELAKLAFYDPKDLFDERGFLKSVTELDDITRAAIAGLDTETREIAGEGPLQRTLLRKIKLADKGLNLERLGRYLKLFTDNVDLHHKVTLEQLVCGGSKVEPGEDARP
ncbi:MAG TPA: terminase small subunit [Silvibacterium sp.]|nr:terminase small subunit [Silvibacterium sp.]